MTAIVTAPLADRTLRAFGSDTRGLTIHLVGAPTTSRVEVRGLDGRIRRFSTRPEALSRVAIVSVPSRRFAVRMDSGRWRWLVRGDADQVWIMRDGDHEDPATYRTALPVPSEGVRVMSGRCWISVDWLARAAGWPLSRGAVPFDGLSSVPSDLLTVRRGGDVETFDTRRNLHARNFEEKFFHDEPNLMIQPVDGMVVGGQYWLTAGVVRRLWDVRLVRVGRQLIALERMHVGFDVLGTSRDVGALGFDQSKLARVGSWIDDQVKAGFSGTSVLVCRHGQIAWRHHAGQALKYSTEVIDHTVHKARLLPPAKQVPVTATTRFDIASNTKMYAGFSGTSVLVCRHGQIAWRHHAGQALKYSTEVIDHTVHKARLLPPAKQVPVTATTRFDIASNTKMYAVNLALQMLVGQGRIDLSRQVCTFPGWEAFRDESTVYTGSWTVGGPGGIKSPFTGKKTIRLVDLMHHRGGLVPDPQYPNATVAGELYLQNLDDISNRTDVIDRICRTPLMYAPHTERAYSDVDYMILGLIVEQVVGKRLDEYLQEGVYRRLGLERTGFRPLDIRTPPDLIAATELNGNTRDGNVGFGTRPDGSPVFIRTQTIRGQVQDEKAFYTMSGVSGHAGLFSTADDLGVLLQLMSNEGMYQGREYFPADVQRRFLTPDGDSATYGLGWRTNGYYYFHGGPSKAAFGHTGWTGTITMVDPIRDIQIVLLTNMRHSPVVEPPNEFAAGAFPLAHYVGLISRVYSALAEDGRVTDVDAPLLERAASSPTSSHRFRVVPRRRSSR